MTKNNNDRTLTVAPVAAAQPSAAEVEWVDFHGAKRMFGLKRSLLYELAGHRLIKSVSLRRNGNIKGKRLWCVQSIRDYLNSQLN